jgi:hypothetical protein
LWKYYERFHFANTKGIERGRGRGELLAKLDFKESQPFRRVTRSGQAPHLPKSTSPGSESSQSQRYRQIIPDRRIRHKQRVQDMLLQSLFGRAQPRPQPLPVRAIWFGQAVDRTLSAWTCVLSSTHTCPFAGRVCLLKRLTSL